MLSTYCVTFIILADFSKDFLTNSDWLRPDLAIAALICFASTGVIRAFKENGIIKIQQRRLTGFTKRLWKNKHDCIVFR